MEIIKFKKYLDNSRGFCALALCALALIASPRASATGDGENEDVNGHFYSRFYPETLENPVELPFVDPVGPLYKIADDSESRIKGIKDINQDEWNKFLNFQVGAVPLHYLLYSMPKLELQSIINDIVENKPDVTLSRQATLVKAGLLQFIAQQPNQVVPPNQRVQDADDRRDLVATALGYLRFSKNVEPYALENIREDDGFFEKPPTGEDVDVATLLDQASKLLVDAKGNRFLQPRIRLQVIRLFYYQQRFAEAISYYRDNIVEFGSIHKDPSPEHAANSVKFRFIAYGAGAYYRSAQVILKKQQALPPGQQLSIADKTNMVQFFAKANYLNSLVFDQFPQLKISSYLAFHPMEQTDWTATLKMAAADPDHPQSAIQKNEVAVLWQLLGIYGKSNNGLDAIRAIYKVDPKSKLLPLLLIREVGKAELAVYQSQDEDFLEPGQPKPTDMKPVVGIDRLALIKSITDEGKVYERYLWELALGHLYSLAEQYDASLVYLKLAKRNKPAVDAMAVPDHAILEVQLQMSSVLQGIGGLKTVNGPVNEELGVDLAGLYGYQAAKSHYRARSLYNWAKDELSLIYAARKDTMRQLMLKDNPSDAFYRDNNNVNAMIELIQAPEGAFDIYLSKASRYSIGQLEELKAINNLYADKITSANESFAQVGDQINDYLLRADPFTDHIQDTYNKDELDEGIFTQVSVAQKIADLELASHGNDLSAAMASLAVGDAFYNMSYYGNSRDLFQSQHHNFKGYQTPDDLSNNDATVDLSNELSLRQDNAQKYYQKALAIAQQLTPATAADRKQVREFEARATWLLAKVERNIYTNKHGAVRFDRASIAEFVTKSEEYKSLRDNFSDTDYYKKIVGQDGIPECGWFAAFAIQ